MFRMSMLGCGFVAVFDIKACIGFSNPGFVIPSYILRLQIPTPANHDVHNASRAVLLRLSTDHPAKAHPNPSGALTVKCGCMYADDYIITDDGLQNYEYLCAKCTASKLEINIGSHYFHTQKLSSTHRDAQKIGSG